DNSDLVARTKGDEAIARIADQGHAGVADESNFSTLLHSNDEFRRTGHFVVFVIGDERLLNVVVREKFLRVACVFAGDLAGFFEDADSAERDVLEIADRCAHEVEAAAGIFKFRRHEGSLARTDSAARLRSVATEPQGAQG